MTAKTPKVTLIIQEKEESILPLESSFKSNNYNSITSYCIMVRIRVVVIINILYNKLCWDMSQLGDHRALSHHNK